MTEKLKYNRDNLLFLLKKFYFKYKHCPDSIKVRCPFGGVFDDMSCSDLCMQFEELENGDVDCPCHLWGPYESIERLRYTLVKEGVLFDDRANE